MIGVLLADVEDALVLAIESWEGMSVAWVTVMMTVGIGVRVAIETFLVGVVMAGMVVTRRGPVIGVVFGGVHAWAGVASMGIMMRAVHVLVTVVGVVC